MTVYLAKRGENIEAKGEIAHYEQFLLLHHCFQKRCQRASICGKGLNNNYYMCGKTPTYLRIHA